jgi:DNA polymerase-3 subunit alpha
MDLAVERLPELVSADRLAAEKELLGFYVTGHPLMPFADVLERYNLATTSTLARLPNRSMTRIGGLISAVQQGVSRKSGKPYALVTLEDMEGSVQVLLLNENYERYRPMLVIRKPVLVIGEVNQGEDRPKLFPQEILPLEDAPRRFTRQVHLRFQTATMTAEHLDRAKDLTAAFPGKVPLFLCFRRPDGETVFIEAHDRCWVRPGPDLQAAVDQAFGENTYYAAVDPSVPDRAPRVWERRASDAA